MCTAYFASVVLLDLAVEMIRSFAEVRHPICFNVIMVYFWFEASQHLIKKGSFHCDRLILNWCYYCH